MYALLALLALGLLLTVHELGHLLAARLLGVSVPRFSVGFGPPLLSFHLFGTEYVIAAIPIGASATLHGMNPHTPGLDPADPRSYSAQRPWKRVVITLAGSLANYLFALGVLFTLYTSGTHVVVPLTVGTVTPGSEAARAQLLPGDRILSVDGLPVKSWSEFVEIIGRSPGLERTLVVVRHGDSRVAQVRPRADERGVGRIGVSQQYVYREHPLGEALTQSLVHTQRVAAEALSLVWSLVTGPAPTTEPPSSVAVVRQSSGAASTGWDAFLRVLGALSVALALLHLVPVPGLDGGRLLFLAIEAARGRPVSPKVETLANTMGFLAIAAAILAVAAAEVRRALPSSEPAPAPPAEAPPQPRSRMRGLPPRTRAPRPHLLPQARQSHPLPLPRMLGPGSHPLPRMLEPGSHLLPWMLGVPPARHPLQMAERGRGMRGELRCRRWCQTQGVPPRKSGERPARGQHPTGDLLPRMLAHPPGRVFFWTPEPLRETRALPTRVEGFILGRFMKRQASAGLFCELYWGTSLAEAWSFGPEQPRVLAAPDEKAPLPLYGFTLPEEPFLLAERTEHGYRIFVPPSVKLERSTKGDAFHELPSSQLVQHEGRASVELPEGTTLRLTEGQLHLLVQHSVAKDRAGRFQLRDFGWLAMVIVLFLSAPVGFLIAGPTPERMMENNARALAAAKEKELARRKALGLDTPLKPIAEEEKQKQQKPDGGTQVTVPASFSVH